MASSVFFTSSYTVFLNASVACSSPGSIIAAFCSTRSEEHTSELQSRLHLVCRLLLGTKDQTTEIQAQQYLLCSLSLPTSSLDLAQLSGLSASRITTLSDDTSNRPSRTSSSTARSSAH